MDQVLKAIQDFFNQAWAWGTVTFGAIGITGVVAIVKLFLASAKLTKLNIEMDSMRKRVNALEDGNVNLIERNKALEQRNSRNEQIIKTIAKASQNKKVKELAKQLVDGAIDATKKVIKVKVVPDEATKL